MEQQSDISQFKRIDLRTGKVISAEYLKDAKQPAYVLQIDFGDLGVLKTSAQLTANYTPDQLPGKRVIAMVNLPEKQIGGLMSQCLVLGVDDENGGVVLLTTDSEVENGKRIY